MRGWSQTMVALGLVACSHEPTAKSPSPHVVVREVALRLGPVHLVVEHDGDEAWATYVAARASAYLPAVEAYLDVPLQQAAAPLFRGLAEPWTIRIVGRQTVMLGPVHIGAYNNTSGVFGDDRGIFVEYARSRVGNPAVVLHELTHDWFRGPGAALKPGATPNDDDPAWFVEGLASMTPLAVAQAGLLALTPAEQTAMRMHWGQWAIPAPTADVAIQHDPRRAGKIGIFYGKSYRAQLLIQRELGDAGYRDLLRRTARKLPRTNEDALALLGAAGPQVDWRGLLRGWIFDGPYSKYAPADVPLFMPAP